MTADETKRLRTLEQANEQLKKLSAKRDLESEGMRSLPQKR